jgi:hypothetical protein
VLAVIPWPRLDINLSLSPTRKLTLQTAASLIVVMVVAVVVVMVVAVMGSAVEEDAVVVVAVLIMPLQQLLLPLTLPPLTVPLPPNRRLHLLLMLNKRQPLLSLLVSLLRPVMRLLHLKRKRSMTRMTSFGGMVMMMARFTVLVMLP